MVLKEIKEFVVSQMKESDWESDHSRDLIKYNSKHIVIRIPNTGKMNFNIKVTGGYSNDDINIKRKELGLNLIHFWILMIYVKNSSKNVEKRKREKEITYQWNRFLERNKDLRRNNKLNKILD
jgi:hypothetical protein